MLQVKNICKEYRTGNLVQKALNDVSLNLRDNEFVAILGPSGSGKTTLLNIIGGLDRYDSGDLIINGVSTKKYKDRDWDSYRNHTIGFVFQSYNLIPHQSVLANVELALTISGISRGDRRRRAEEALRKVGLGDHMHKKPSQMSGGQMQRVAIARALVNNPEILLADEPTGALDSETSVQVMELLKEVAKDRLVVMVTHNPELAEQYATRIVRVKDGRINDDTDPYIVENGEAVHKNFGRASMTFLTALGLSFNNLKTKLARTLLVATAGSIGIIGIALILSLSTGVNEYIKGVEEDTLSEYPLEITNTSFDISSFMSVEVETWKSEAEVVEWKTISNMLTKLSANDLGSLRTYLESGESGIEEYSRAIEYKYGFSPEIYSIDGTKYYQINPDTTFAKMGFSNLSTFMTGTNSDSFMILPENDELYKNQYEVMAGDWPKNDNELVVVLTESGRISDMTLYALGLKDHDELDALVKTYKTGEEIEIDESVSEYAYTDFIGLKYKLVHACDYYKYDSEYEVWTNKQEDKQFMRQLIRDGEDLTVVGIVKPKEDASVTMLSSGVYYRPGLMKNAIAYAAGSELVKAQMAKPDTDIISNTIFGEETDGSFDLQDLFTVDEDALENAIKFDSSVLYMDFGDLGFSNMNPSDFDMTPLLEAVSFTPDSEALNELFQELAEDYAESQLDNPATDITQLPAAVGAYLGTEEAAQIINDFEDLVLNDSNISEIVENALPGAIADVMSGYAAYAAANGITDLSGLADYMQTAEAQAIMQKQSANISNLVSNVSIPQDSIEKLSKNLADGYEGYAKENNLPSPSLIQSGFNSWLESETVRTRIMETLMGMVDTSQMGDAMVQVMEPITTQVANAFAAAMSRMGYAMENAISIDADAFANAFKVTMTEEELQELMAAMMTKSVTTYDGNLVKMGYFDLEKPSSIVIYPRDFNAKNEVKNILDSYNDRMRDTDQDEKVVAYADIVGTLMSSITKIINAISYVLIAFVAISLVVSSIMIGVITYISVLERKKEIGILRAIGASKRNISEVFNAETFIIGLLAGVIGIIGTEIILIPGNILIHHLADMDDISAFLPPSAAILLIALSVVLTLIGGIIPSRKAAKSDPVTALRTE